MVEEKSEQGEHERVIVNNQGCYALKATFAGPLLRFIRIIALTTLDNLRNLLLMPPAETLGFLQQLREAP
jgi:hypothetical protein